MTDRSNTDPPTYADDSDKVDGKDAADIAFSGDHRDLTNVNSSQHHARPSGGSGVSFDSTNNQYDALLGNALGIDANGNIYVQESNVSHDSIAGVSASDHHAKPTGGTGVSFDSTNNQYDALLGNALGIDANGNIYVKEGSINHGNLAGTPSFARNTGSFSVGAGSGTKTVSFTNSFSTQIISVYAGITSTANSSGDDIISCGVVMSSVSATSMDIKYRNATGSTNTIEWSVGGIL